MAHVSESSYLSYQINVVGSKAQYFTLNCRGVEG